MYWNDVLRIVFASITRLTLTWDVLKWRVFESKAWFFRININMRCIEIQGHMKLHMIFVGLTLTWDVLKWYLKIVRQVQCMININMRCIEMELFLHFESVLTD